MTTAGFWTLARAAGVVFLLGVSAICLPGCDGAGSKQASLYQRLTGSWTVERLEGGGSFEFDYTNRLNQRYSRVGVEFRSVESGRSYRVTGTPVGDTTRVLAEGPVVLRGDQLLIMATGFSEPNGLQSPVSWTYQFDASRAIFRLPANQQNGSRAFMSTVLPSMGWSESDGVRLQLAPVQE